MNNQLKKVVEKLLTSNKTISSMESCTGGSLASHITNCDDASKVLKFSAVTYSNEFKIKMGVKKETIDKYSVYSENVAIEMSKCIASFSNSDYGIGITGKLNKADEANLYGEDNLVFISIYDKKIDKNYNYQIHVFEKSREENKNKVIELVLAKLIDIVK